MRWPTCCSTRRLMLSLALLASSVLPAGPAAAAPLSAVEAQYPDIHGTGTITYGGPGYAHGYGDSYGGYGASPSAPQPFAPTPAGTTLYAPLQYYHQFHPGYPYGCPGVFPC
ncbi:MAG: hypothetical protein IRZ14_05070 [Chloroflexi bacterium]|nr:hypothetical protein [Chloroflexota bacterium]